MNLLIVEVKKILIYLRNLLIWLAPFLVFILTLLLVIFIFKGHLEEYADLLEILIWPVTTLICLFFFRKVVTYMFFSMDGFNFFGVKGELKNVDQMINEEVQKRLIKEKEEQANQEEMRKIEAKISDTSATAQDSLQLAKDIFKSYQEYKTENEERVEKLITQNKFLRENINKIQKSENSTPIPTEQTTADMGTGEKVENQTLGEPDHE